MLIAITEPLSVALAPIGIIVNSVDPGPTDFGWMNDEIKEHLLPQFPMGRIGTPEDAAKLIKFLASDEAGWITAQHIKSEGSFTVDNEHRRVQLVGGSSNESLPGCIISYRD